MRAGISLADPWRCAGLTSHEGWLVFRTGRVSRHVRPLATRTQHCPDRAGLLSCLGPGPLARDLCIATGMTPMDPA